MRSLYKHSREPGRGQFQGLKQMWNYSKHVSQKTKARGKVFGLLFAAAFIGSMIHSLLTPQIGLVKVSLFHLMQ
ncbi:MAG: hypothetical protein UT33_C0011G0141 [Candidatus Peregrinibacteria bacterium GW2011_GWC2_39_14]|nr:MAG: hypothetical protein UT33_C0011G0141 [Candidatus Peregrinibacteria bacterium GW2011_GWC2_39_14]